MSLSCPTFWSENPSILWKDPKDFYPFSEDAKKCSTTALNSLTRFGIYLAIALTIASFIFLPSVAAVNNFLTSGK